MREAEHATPGARGAWRVERGAVRAGERLRGDVEDAQVYLVTSSAMSAMYASLAASCVMPAGNTEQNDETRVNKDETRVNKDERE